MLKRFMLLCCFLLVLPASAQAKQNMLLLKVWQPTQQVKGWLMSEKLDGVRARWDGHRLISRGGHVFAAPEWFIRGFPPFAVDGELWSKRGDFENIVSIVRRKQPHAAWRQLTYQIFEVPDQAGGLLARLQVLKAYLSTHANSYMHIIEQTTCHGQKHLQKHLQQLVSLGAEGLVVRDPATPYQTGRSSAALKVKKFMDSECTVIGYKAGKGKLTGLTGALLCRMDNGMLTSIGSGLNQRLRSTPPALGQIITFKYYGLTKNGKPRHPVFLRLWQGDVL
ncbi:MAG: DNA ligase [Mariprofundaceae bacterium]|nr:DNA ligase [Mariprofundaceae bacterium]